MLEQIISRGLAGAERAALEAGRAAGLPTGGQSRPGIVTPAVARRLGLNLDAGCSARQALAFNVLRASGTLVLGVVSDRLLRQLGPRVFRAAWTTAGSASMLADWCRHHRIRALNVLGGESADDTQQTGWLVWDLVDRLGRRPRLPVDRGCAFTAVGRRLFAVRLWPTPRAWRWHGDRGWLPHRGWHRVVRTQPAWQCWRDGEEASHAHCARRLSRLLPPVVRNAVLCRDRIDARLLALFARMPRVTTDLARAGRHGVLRLLAEADDWLSLCRRARIHPEITGRTDRRLDPRIGRRPLRRLARGRQRDLLAGFGFHGTESVVRAVAKLPVPVDLHSLNSLRDAMHDPVAAAALRHVRVLNEPVLHAATSPTLARAAAPSFWEQLSRFSDGWSVANVCEDLSAGASRLHREPVPAGSIGSLRALFAVITRPEGDPPPHVPGVPGVIERLDTAAKLRAEGSAMAHCVGQYTDRVAAGWTAIYRVIGRVEADVDRATVMLQFEGGRWAVAQLSGRANAPVSPQTRSWVGFWLETAQADGDELTIAERIIEKAMRSLAG